MRATRRLPMQKELQSCIGSSNPFVIRNTRVAPTRSSNIDVATLVWAPFLCSNVHGVHDRLLGCLHAMIFATPYCSVNTNHNSREKLSAIINDINLDERNAPSNLCAAEKGNCYIAL
ncbi:hypothetical protein V6N13_017632 [Hibiscus sabdariffa]